ncbi:SigE family RNA polymerase sigma factor [Allokutzneria sp. A3M-2-11 16]|uniref:SigE family RNA polymerase sigma factor n=1 Tax=Allokutzneria sp. A3M-2-11 16 TaxID=2962043 RepID=UPI0020B798EC|nr:SigE family RNA polymerase sigma factor [Allokutzneria sp. A3M-2-11 16]MCP3803069.1 SigE family RNA polymerase sigma factor [Allokutzneria sp. A3M-2-11 16]
MATVDDGFVEFVRERSSALLRTARLLCAGDRAAAEDLVQDVLARVYCRWSRIVGDPEPYVRTALFNAAKHRWRRRSRRVAEAQWDDALMSEHPSAEGGHEDQLAARDVAMRALAQLPPRMRAVIVLRFFEDYSEEQTANVLGCSTGTVKSQTSRGLTKLRGLIDLTGDRVEEPR